MNGMITRRRALTGILAAAAAAATAGVATACSTGAASAGDGKTVKLLTSTDPRIADNVRATLGTDFTARTGITVTFEQAGGPRWQDVDTRLQSDLTAGNRPDVAIVGINSVRTYSDSNLTKPLDDLMAQANFDSSQYSPTLLDVGRQGDQIMGVPYCVSMLVMYLNLDVLRKAGLDPNRPPATFAELREYAEKIVSTNSARYGVAWPYDTDSNWALQSMLFAAGGSMMDSAEKQVTVNDKPVVDLLQYWRDRVEEGTSTVINASDLTAAFIRGDIGMILQSSSASSAIAKGVSFPIRADVLPVPDGGTRRTPPGGGSAIILAEDETVQQSAWQVIQELISPAGQTQLVTTSGYTSVNQQALSDPQYLGTLMREDPLRAAGVAEIATMVPWYQFPGSRAVEASDELKNAVAASLIGEAPVNQALDDAAATISDLVAR